jgi:sigma-B regulation protein RsbU (phosphoserine phosphatase)
MTAVKELIKSLTGAFGLALLAYLLLNGACEMTKMPRWRHNATAQSAIQMRGATTPVFSFVDAAEFSRLPLPVLGDTVVSVADSAATADRWNRYLDSPRKAHTVAVEFTHDGVVYSNAITTRSPTSTEYSLVWALQILRYLIAFLFLGVALWAFFARPDSAGVRVLAFFSFCMSALMMCGVTVLSDRFGSFVIPYNNIVRSILNNVSLFGGAFWLNLSLQFPRPAALMRKHPVWTYLLCYVPLSLLLISAFVATQLEQNWPINLVLVFLLAVQIIAGMILLGYRYYHSADHIERRQTRLVLWGTGTGLAIIFGGILLTRIPWIAQDGKRMLVVINLAFLGPLLSPISFAYAFGRYRLLEVEARLRRGTRYALAIIVVVLVVAGFGYAGGAYLQNILTQGNPLGTVILVAAALLVVPSARVARKVLEKKFYPERQRLRDLLGGFLQRSFTVSDRHSFWNELEQHLQQQLMVEGVYPLLRKMDNGAFYCRNHEHTPFHERSDLTQKLERDPRPIMIDEALASRRLRLSPEETVWLTDRRIAVVLPLVTHSHLIGFLGLGMKMEQDDYAAEELRILDSLASQVALASENIRLLEENVDKKRLEEQLEMARRIQHGFLPAQIPQTPGLEIAARTRFCLEVAGDYYDIIPLPGGETVMAVGDVSGKGAGAALLMANLQASLRTAVGVGISLAEIVARINQLIHRNTPPEQFITFFVGIYNPLRGDLTYVNAGHNPPMLFRGGRVVQELDIGGLILGMQAVSPYQQGTVKLRTDDLLLMYTDGVSEAMNSLDEEFGEPRIQQAILQRAGDPCCKILDHLEEEVTVFRGQTALDDDSTLLLARITEHAPPLGARPDSVV